MDHFNWPLTEETKASHKSREKRSGALYATYVSRLHVLWIQNTQAAHSTKVNVTSEN